MNFLAIFIFLGIIAFIAAVYFWTRFHKFAICQKIAAKRRLLSWLLALIPVAIMGGLVYLSAFTVIVCILHLFAIWLLADLIGWIVKKLTGREQKIYWQGIGAIAVFALYMFLGYYVAHHVVETDYKVEAINHGQKVDESLRIAMIADAHIGATFDGEGFAREVEKIQQSDPDLLVIVGDFVDDDTSKADMVRACEALGQLKTEYGVYYVFGNHDKGYFNYRDFSTNDLVEELQGNRVRVLEDEIVSIGSSYQLVGRQDKSNPARASIESLMDMADSDKYSIILDHQPNDFAAEAQTEADLVLSGHTHGGWLWPMAYISSIIGPDDRIYGTETREDTDFVVTSGISDWRLPIKTGTKSEFVIIDLN